MGKYWFITCKMKGKKMRYKLWVEGRLNIERDS
jgi:hypothetical protein